MTGRKDDDPDKGKLAEEVNGAARGSGQGTGHGNPGEEPDSDPQGGDGSNRLGPGQTMPPPD